MSTARIGRSAWRHRIGWTGVALGLLSWIAGCSPDSESDSDTFGPPGTEPPVIAPSPFVVSDPVGNAAHDGASAAIAGGTGSRVTTVVYVSLAEGEIPTGTSTSIRNRRTGTTATTPMVAGGFDPVAVEAAAGDTLEIEIEVSSGPGPLSFLLRVPLAAPPIVVRTEPADGKRDVPLNARIVIVFSEPIDGTTITGATIRLKRGIVEVPGAVQFASAEQLTVEFVPDEPLEPNADYELEITQGIEDLDGEALEAPVMVVFVTQPADASSGAVRIAVVETGADLDGGYLITLDGGLPAPLTAGSTLLIAPITSGGHAIELTDVASNCVVVGPNPANVNVTSGDTLGVGFEVSCAAAQRTGVDLVVTTTGADLPADHYVRFYRNGDECFDMFDCPYLFADRVPANGTVEVDLPAAQYTVSWFTSANCGGSGGGGQVTVSPGQVTTVPMNYACQALGALVVNVLWSGMDFPPLVLISADYSGATTLSGGSAMFRVLAGTRSVQLSRVPNNCTVEGPNPVSVEVVSGGTTNVTFPVSCVENPTLRISVATAGPNAPPTYVVGVDEDPDWWGYLYTTSAPSNGEVSIRLLAGTHIVTLDEIPPNCVVTGPNPVSVAMPPGSVTDLAFNVTCS